MMTVRLSEAERLMLGKLADDAGLSASDIVRTLVRDAYRAKHGEKAPRSKK